MSSLLQKLFDDKRILIALLGLWTLFSTAMFGFIMIEDGSHFLSFGPNPETVLFGSKLDSWTKWWLVAVYTFLSTAIAAFSSDAVVPWITNTIQDHKTRYIPYAPWMCILIIQIFTIYAVIMSVIGLFVALSQIDFMLIRLAADLFVNHVTTVWFLRGKVVDANKCGMETHDMCSRCRGIDSRWDSEIDDIDLGDLEFRDLSDGVIQLVRAQEAQEAQEQHKSALGTERQENVEKGESIGAVVANSVLDHSNHPQ